MKTIYFYLLMLTICANAENLNAQTKFSFGNTNEQILANDIKISENQGNAVKCVLGANGPSIQWETAEEVNTSHFEIQVSYDGTEFTSIRNVAASEITNWTTFYEAKFHKNYISAEKVYYRLKTVFTDGSETITTPISFIIVNSEGTSYASIH